MVSGSCPIALTCSHPPDISEALRQSFREAFSNEGHPSDGHIYRQIRLYDLQGNANPAGQWWARLSPNKRQDMEEIAQPEEPPDMCRGLACPPGSPRPVRRGQGRNVEKVDGLTM